MMLEAIALGAVVGGPLGYMGHAWWRSRQKARRLSAVYSRYEPEPTTVVVPAVEPPRRPRARAWMGWSKHRPVQMNLPAVRPLEDADEALWSKRPSQLSKREPDPRGFDPALTLPFATDDAPVFERRETPAFEGHGGGFGGAGASGGWDAADAETPADTAAPSFDTPSGGSDGGSFGSDP